MTFFYKAVKFIAIFILASVSFKSAFSQTTFYVKPIAAGTGDGSSWANASAGIESVILNGVAGDNIWVAAGVYKPAGNFQGDRNASFNLKNGVAIYGGFVGNETSFSQRNWKANTTILSGDFLNNDIVTGSGTLTFSNISENSVHVVRAQSVNTTAILDGFTVKGGNADNGAEGGGMFVRSASPTLQNIIFVNNFGFYGGGMYNENSSSPKLNNVVFYRNGTFNAGGGMYNISSTPNLTNTLFIENAARGGNSNGGGMYNFSSTPVIRNSVFVSNSSIGEGGGLCNAFSSTNASNCIFWANVGLGATTQQIQSGGGSPSTTYSIVEGSSVYSGTGNSNSNPLFADLVDYDGVDNIWLTADDGLRIPCNSPANNAGSGSTPLLDIIGNTRIGAIDIGPYESNNSTIASNLLPVNFTSVYINQTASVINYSDCNNQVLRIDGTSPNTILGNVAAKVWVDATQNTQFVKRHFEISPVANPTTAIGRITLFFTDADFIGFNTQTVAPSLLLPVSTDLGATLSSRKANLRIEKRAGVGDENGSINSYIGTVTTIDPDDNDIAWNATAARWEVTFNVTGFSGFWVKTQTGVLPLNLLSFTVNKNIDGNSLLWKTSNEINLKSFAIERSYDGISFLTIGNINAIGLGSGNYNFSDLNTYSTIVYYRLKMSDIDGRFIYSQIIVLSKTSNKLSMAYPNPIKERITLQIGDKKLLNTYANVIDINGRIVLTVFIRNDFQILDLKLLTAGIYFMKLANGETLKLIKENS